MNEQMKERIKKQLTLTLPGETKKMFGNDCITGDISGIWGDVSDVRGDASGIWGDVSDIKGDISGINGYVQEIIAVLRGG